MTVVLAVLLPVILVYQGWTYHVFRGRLGGEVHVAEPTPAREHTTAGLPTR